jgi:putative protease
MPEIVDIGVSALKIEGRYKDANYVALTTAPTGRRWTKAWPGCPDITRVEEMQLSRSIRAGWARILCRARTIRRWCAAVRPRHRGVKVGVVQRVLADQRAHRAGTCRDAAPLKPGDGLVFDAADWRSPAEPEKAALFTVRDADKRR